MEMQKQQRQQQMRQMLILLILVQAMLLLLQVLVNVHGNSATATKLQTARTISLSGDVTGSASFDGSSNVIITTDLANVAVLSGSVTLTASSSSGQTYSQTNFELNYPSGYNKSNTLVLGFKVKLQGTGTGNYTFGCTPDKSSMSSSNGAYPRTVRLDDNNLTVSVYNLSISRKLDYVIYLMKI